MMNTQDNPISSRKSFSQASTRLQALLNETFAELLANAQGEKPTITKTQANEILAKALSARSYNHLSACFKSAVADTSGAIAAKADLPKLSAVKILSEVTCLNEWADCPPCFATVELSAKLVVQILEHQRKVKEEGLVSIVIDAPQVAFYEGSDAYWEMPGMAAFSHLGEQCNTTAAKAYEQAFSQNDLVRMSDASIEITQFDFTISAVIDGCSDSFKCTTPCVSIEQLDAAQKAQKGLLCLVDPNYGQEVLLF